MSRCEHDNRFGGVMGLPPECGGCLACYAERLRAKLDAYDVYCSKMESAADIIADHVPTGTSPIIGQWRIQKLQEGIQFLLQACRECAEAHEKADRKKGGGE